jgi:plasmid stabilization system protein ParE
VKFRVRLAAKAEEDIDVTLRWFQESQAMAAGERWFSRLLGTINTLETSPVCCGVAAESGELGIEIRELLFGKRRSVYRILFLIDGQTVHVLRVRRGARDRIAREDL